MSLTESQVKSSRYHQIVFLKRFLSSHFYVLIMSFTALFEDLRNQFAKVVCHDQFTKLINRVKYI